MEIKKLNKLNLKQLTYLEQELFLNPFSENSCLDELTNKNRLYLGLFNNNQLIAYAGATTSFSDADIIKVGVLKSEQGKGYGKKILGALISALKENGITNIMLEVEHQNFKAINLYLGFGFKEISERKNYYGENSHAKIFKLEI